MAELDGSVRPMTITDWFFLYVGTAEANALLRPGHDPHILAVDLQGQPQLAANTPATRAQTSVCCCGAWKLGAGRIHCRFHLMIID